MEGKKDMKKVVLERITYLTIATIGILLTSPIVVYCTKENQKMLPKGTVIKLELMEPLSSQENKTGDVVRYSVVGNVAIDGVVLIKSGAGATGKVVDAKPAKGWGKGGKLDISVEEVEAVDGSKVLLVASMGEGKSWAGLKTIGGVALLGLAFGGAIKGKKVSIPKGTQVDVYVEKDAAISTNIVKNVEKQIASKVTEHIAENGSKKTETTKTPTAPVAQDVPKVEMIITKEENGIVTFSSCTAAGIKSGDILKANKVVTSKSTRKEFPYAELEVLTVSEGFCAAKLLNVKQNVAVAAGDTVTCVEAK